MIDAITGDKAEESTEWEDIHRAAGNFVPKPKRMCSNKAFDLFHGAVQAERERRRENRSLTALDEAFEEDENDELEVLREKRLAELKTQSRRARFGSISQIRKIDFVREVNEASARAIDLSSASCSTTASPSLEENESPSDEELAASLVSKPEGGNRILKQGKKLSEVEAVASRCQNDVSCTWVVVYLFQEYLKECQLCKKQLEKLALKFSSVKFVSGVANEIIPGFPDRGVPSLFLYNRGVCQKQIFLTSEVFDCDGGFWYREKEGGKGSNAFLFRTLEWLLWDNGVLESVVPRGGEWDRSGVAGGNVAAVETAVGRIQIGDPRIYADSILESDEEMDEEKKLTRSWKNYMHEKREYVEYREDREYTERKQ